MAKPKYREKKPIYPIICPYCYEEFNHEAVHFRAAGNKHYEGNTLFDYPVADRKLAGYRSRFNLDTSNMPPSIVPDNSLGGIEYIKCTDKKYNYDGVLVQVTDEFGAPSAIRICPSCHNILPKSAAKTKSCIVAFLGDTSVGKTIYMTTLIDTLQKKVSINFDADCKPIDNYTYKNYSEKYYQPIYKHGLLPPPTMKNELTYPLMFELNLGKIYLSQDKEEWEPEKSVTLAFYDVAGEGMKDKRYLDTFGKHLRHADAYIFLVDPLQTAITSRITAKTGVEDVNYRDSAVAILNAIEANDIIDTSKLIAIVLTKSDLLKNIGSELVHEHSNIFRKTNYNGYIDLTEIASINEEVKKLLQKADQVFLHYIERTFRKYAYFAVSSLGGQVEKGADGFHRISGGAPDPLRVEEPFLWILYKLGYISGTDPKSVKKRFGFLEKFFS